MHARSEIYSEKRNQLNNFWSSELTGKKESNEQPFERHRFKMHVNERYEILSSSFDMSWFLKLH